MKYIAYIRKSSEQEERQSLSIPAQIRKIKELFPDILIVKWIQESKSAFKPGRPGFQEMVELLNTGKADGIVSWHPDRLSRNEIDAAYITYGLRSGVIKDLKFGSYLFDNSPEGIMMLQNVMSHSQYFSSKLSKDVKRGNDEQRSRGWLTGQAMEGYLNARTTDGLKHGIIVKDPDRFNLRRQMWDLMLTGDYSVPQIANIANNQWGYMTRGNKKYPSAPIVKSSLSAMFKNPRYAGQIPNPEKPGEYLKASYPAMVSIEEFDRVQELLGSRGTRRLTAKKTFAFRGPLVCGECGCLITAEDKYKRFKNGTTKHYIYYHCTHKRPCTQRSNIREEDLEEQFIELLNKYTILPQFKDWALEALEEQNETETTDIGAVLNNQSRVIESSHKEMKGLIKMASRELITEDQFLQEKKGLEIRIANLESEREDTKKAS